MKDKGIAINFTTSTIIVFLVMVVSLLIITDSRVSTLFTAEALKGLFEPNKFKPCSLDEEGLCAPGIKISAENVALNCGNLFSRSAVVNIEKIGFTYYNPGEQRLGPRFYFLLALGYKEHLILGSKAGNTKFECKRFSDDGRYECEKFDNKNSLKFELFDVSTGDRIVLHITAWKYDASLQKTVDGTKSFSEVIDEFYPFYMGSVDVPIKVVNIDTTTCSTPILMLYHTPPNPNTQNEITVVAEATGAYDKIVISVRKEAGFLEDSLYEEKSCRPPEDKCEWSKFALSIGKYVYEAKTFDTNGKQQLYKKGEFEVDVYMPPV